jgi:hypothetical protein
VECDPDVTLPNGTAHSHHMYCFPCNAYLYRLYCRSLGDLDFKEPARFVECDPDVTRLPLLPHKDSFVILGSDGLWDVLSDTDAVATAAAALRVCVLADMWEEGVVCGRGGVYVGRGWRGGCWASRGGYGFLGSDGLWDVLSDTDADATAAAAPEVRRSTEEQPRRNLCVHVPRRPILCISAE